MNFWWVIFENLFEFLNQNFRSFKNNRIYLIYFLIFQIKEYERLETTEERMVKAKEIYDHHMMVEMLAHTHVSTIDSSSFFLQRVSGSFFPSVRVVGNFTLSFTPKKAFFVEMFSQITHVLHVFFFFFFRTTRKTRFSTFNVIWWKAMCLLTYFRWVGQRENWFYSNCPGFVPSRISLANKLPI